MLVNFFEFNLLVGINGLNVSISKHVCKIFMVYCTILICLISLKGLNIINWDISKY